MNGGSTEAKVESIQKQLVVEAPQERAFRVFTERFDTWWPRTHKILQAELKEAVLEQKAGGRWYERGVDGTECDWGRVLVWEPPRRLVVTWQLTAEWKFDPDFVTEVEVVFTPLGPKRTRVDLEHRNLDRYGAAAGMTRKSLEGEGGWGGILTMFKKVAEG